MNLKQIEGGVTAAKGFSAAGTRAGIKKGKTNKDMAMIKIYTTKKFPNFTKAIITMWLGLAFLCL